MSKDVKFNNIEFIARQYLRDLDNGPDEGEKFEYLYYQEISNELNSSPDKTKIWDKISEILLDGLSQNEIVIVGNLGIGKIKGITVLIYNEEKDYIHERNITLKFKKQFRKSIIDVQFNLKVAHLAKNY